ncbi:hypothetical protein [Mesobacillus foraminis]|uniref:hypothetical protein n=1 Tax=Mesobacillus foraminis TaxID=279826 RepID=UPI0015E6521B|nr:hypothetical protein [Mesobacillus foraminis]
MLLNEYTLTRATQVGTGTQRYLPSISYVTQTVAGQNTFTVSIFVAATSSVTAINAENRILTAMVVNQT